MSAYDDFCGCGEYDCGECFGGGAPRPPGNAWLDLACRVFPNSRSMTREERRAFDASFWGEMEPLSITDDTNDEATGP